MTTAIRKAAVQDAEEIRAIHLSAFGDDENEQVAELAVELLREAEGPQTVAWVAETDGVLSGHIGFSQVTLADAPEFKGSILAPLGVRSGFQKKGVGSDLVRHGIDWLAGSGTKVVFVYGDPDYYGRFGFSVDAVQAFEPPYSLQYPHGWQALSLNDSESPPQPGRISCVKALSDPALW